MEGHRRGEVQRGPGRGRTQGKGGGQEEREGERIGSGVGGRGGGERRGAANLATESAAAPAKAVHSRRRQAADLMSSPPFPRYSLAFSISRTCPATAAACGSGSGFPARCSAKTTSPSP